MMPSLLWRGWSSRVRMWCAVVPLLVPLLACEEMACGTTTTSDVEPWLTCEVVDTECDSDVNLPPELDPTCNPDLSDYDLASWAEPGAPSRTLPERMSGFRQQGDGTTLHLAFAPEHHAPGITVWLTGDEDLEFSFSLEHGTQARDHDSVRAVLLIDALVQAFEANADGAVVSALSFPLRPGDTVRHSLRVPAEAISVGAHSVQLLVWAPEGFDVASGLFAVLREDARFLNRPPAVSAEVVSVFRELGTGLTLIPTGPNDEGEVVVSMSVSPGDLGFCDAMLRRITLVAFVDERQVEIADLGMRPAFDLRPGEGVFLDVTFQHLPKTAGHSVRMWALRGEGAYTEAPLGKASPWYRAARHMGRVAW